MSVGNLLNATVHKMSPSQANTYVHLDCSTKSSGYIQLILIADLASAGLSSASSMVIGYHPTARPEGLNSV